MVPYHTTASVHTPGPHNQEQRNASAVELALSHVPKSCYECLVCRIETCRQRQDYLGRGKCKEEDGGVHDKEFVPTRTTVPGHVPLF